MEKSAIICVDDDQIILKSLKKELEDEFGNDYLIEVAESGNSALKIFDELISDDYKVPVIISDYIMPGMKGDELLKLIHAKNSRTFKIMLTGQAEAEGISNAVNNANLYRIISKPWKYDELVFTINEAIKNYKKNEFIEKQYFELKKNKELTDELKKYNFKFNKLVDEKKRLFNQVIPSLIELTTVFENGYFLNHTKYIIGLSLKIADELQLEAEDRITIVISCILLHQIMREMPEKFIAKDPNFLDKIEAKEYFTIFNQKIDKLSELEFLNKYVIVLSQIWEHFDGTGLPHGLTLSKIQKVTQIINISINYHIGVYSFPSDGLKILKETCELSQTPELTAQRHAATLQNIFKNSSWYDMDIIDVFQRLFKQKSSKEILLEKGLIKVYLNGDNIRIIRYKPDDFHYDKEQKIVIPVEKLMKDIQKQSSEEIGKKKRALETELEVNEIRPGMITGVDVYTKFGRLIVPQNTIITNEIIEEFNKTQKNGLFKENDMFKVLIPREV